MNSARSGEEVDAGHRAPPPPPSPPAGEDTGLTPTTQSSERRQAAERAGWRIGPIDVERQCGVPLPAGRHCGGSLACKRHSMSSKRSVAGRSAPYDQLLAALIERNRSEKRALEETS
ncbi:hypothetical protein CORC01_10983 [Colletotrichum orchidophilum]|uniref:SCA7 domain-containing protein n=1 Tax=Colletotrichum orchidophilum TaxID=1209926 RepID=A0A1G4AXB2_9PEZI|nr:uncharacterized protein CORC01_10983 [Colletotrichum orchidophilum]OHE93756.1 hypothetical protein CORC01_10983 [Colletotrichum orchidophilum]